MQVQENFVNEERPVLFIQTDTGDRGGVEALVNTTIEKYGRIDILVNNAGTTKDAMLIKMTEQQFDDVININLKGVFNCTQCVIPYMISQGSGKIINTSSVSGVYGNVGQTNYAASKAALIGMTKTWAKEFGRKGIQVNAVAPGFTLTPMVQKCQKKYWRRWRRLYPYDVWENRRILPMPIYSLHLMNPIILQVMCFM